MSDVVISGYSFSTCSTYVSPSLRIADSNSTVTIQLTTSQRPDDLYTQKVFTLSNSDYSYLRPMVTSDSLVRYEGYISSENTTGYRGVSDTLTRKTTYSHSNSLFESSVTGFKQLSSVSNEIRITYYTKITSETILTTLGNSVFTNTKTFYTYSNATLETTFPRKASVTFAISDYGYTSTSNYHYNAFNMSSANNYLSTVFNGLNITRTIEVMSGTISDSIITNTSLFTQVFGATMLDTTRAYITNDTLIHFVVSIPSSANFLAVYFSDYNRLFSRTSSNSMNVGKEYCNFLLSRHMYAYQHLSQQDSSWIRIGANYSNGIGNNLYEVWYRSLNYGGSNYTNTSSFIFGYNIGGIYSTTSYNQTTLRTESLIDGTTTYSSTMSSFLFNDIYYGEDDLTDIIFNYRSLMTETQGFDRVTIKFSDNSVYNTVFYSDRALSISSTTNTISVLYSSSCSTSSITKEVFYTSSTYTLTSTSNSGISSTTALTQASYYTTSSSTIGSMSSTSSIGSTIRV